ncbi:hypothetical protein OPV22_004557 [Ensete ventricosum]|uniref:Uncharacterized protein n=1 Tax=Ensete ventricosum TaxID=4639 RepID=A0AAV8RMM2_ENSVE|nr:hypothetical protein OPV22_004557 [Ensete ventricosum]RWW41225.1 hypothetical protein BHE74_00053302 [Ensete ventricosum]
MLAKSSGSSPLSPIRIKQEGTFYARLLSKENSLSATPSFRVYHGVAPASVPFVWESQPGTPKATFAAAQLPPLTPPPSYFHHPRKTMAAKKKPKSSTSFSYLATLFRRLTLRKPCMPHPPMSKSPVSSLSSSPFSRLGSSDSRQKHSFSSGVPDDEDAAGGSILCFRLQRIPRLSLFRRRRDRQKNLVIERFG